MQSLDDLLGSSDSMEGRGDPVGVVDEPPNH